MRASPTCRRRACSFLLATLLALPEVTEGAQAQGAAGPPAIPQELVTLLAGDILEILPISLLQFPKYTWILTKERTFLEAGREGSFRTRLTQAGNYELHAELRGLQGERIRRIFRVNVLPRTPEGEETATGATTNDILASKPRANRLGVSIFEEGHELILLEPHGEVTALTLDFDTSIDRDGDGNPANDSDSEGTFFESEGTPLFLWFTDPPEFQETATSARSPLGLPMTQKIAFTSRAYAEAHGLLSGEFGIESSEEGAGTFGFSVLFDDGKPPATPLLYEWDFGDGEQSLAESPTYTYARDGTYTVRAATRNLATGEEMATATLEVRVTGASAIVKEGESEEGNPSTKLRAGEDKKEGGGGWLGMVGLVLLVLLLAAGGTYGVIFYLKKKHELLPEEGKEEKEALEGKPPPLDVKVVPPERKEPAKESKEEKESKKEAVPSWLPPLTPPPRVQSPPPPKPTSPPTSVPPAPSPARPEPVERVEGSAPINTKNAPPWLAQGLSKASAPQAAPPTSAAPRTDSSARSESGAGVPSAPSVPPPPPPPPPKPATPPQPPKPTPPPSPEPPKPQAVAETPKQAPPPQKPETGSTSVTSAAPRTDSSARSESGAGATSAPSVPSPPSPPPPSTPTGSEPNVVQGSTDPIAFIRVDTLEGKGEQGTSP